MSAGPGFLEVGLSRDRKQVIVNHPKLQQNEQGGYMVFSPQEALDLARSLVFHAIEASSSS